MRVALAAAALLLTAHAALAQDLHAYLGGSLFVSTQGSHRPGTSPDMPLTGVGGTTWGGSAEAGGYIGARTSVSVEYSRPARIEAIQETDYFSIYETRSEYRDEIVSFLLHVSSRPGRVLRVTAVGGAAFVRESALQSTAYAPAPTRTFGPFTAEREVTRWTPGVIGGVDLEIPATRRLSVIPQARLLWVSRSDDPSQAMWFLGLDAVVFRGGIGVRASF